MLVVVVALRYKTRNLGEGLSFVLFIIACLSAWKSRSVPAGKTEDVMFTSSVVSLLLCQKYLQMKLSVCNRVLAEVTHKYVNPFSKDLVSLEVYV